MRGRELRQGIIVGMLVLVAGWLLSLIWGLAEKAQVAITEANNAKAQYEQLEARRRTLEADVNALDTPRGQDAAIRTAFGVARPGEAVVVVVPPATTSATTTRSWWQRLRDLF